MSPEHRCTFADSFTIGHPAQSTHSNQRRPDPDRPHFLRLQRGLPADALFLGSRLRRRRI